MSTVFGERSFEDVRTCPHEEGGVENYTAQLGHRRPATNYFFVTIAFEKKDGIILCGKSPSG